jgi:ABC-type lipoprotein release transport system permease subunit
VENLRRVGDLPLIFAGLLTALAVATLGHTLVTAVHRRRHELATLKTVGFVPHQVAATVAWLATSLVVVALAVGLPLGVAAGRWGWTVVADGIGTPAAPVTPTFAVLVTIPLALLVANSIAAFPARAAARVRPAVALRAE